MTDPSLAPAIQDFRRARRQADLQEIMARLRGRSTDLLSYEQVRQKLRAQNESTRGLQDIPLDAIIGSVGRYADFNRSFLPLRDGDEQRWARVKLAVEDLAGLPPIEVYQIGGAYFVKDGNHRVSVARRLGASHIQAYVTEVRSKVPLTPNVTPDELILKAEYAEFLEHTHLDELRPEADLDVTVPGEYETLEEHVRVHRHFMGLEQQREIPYEEAAAHWYDVVYWPIVQVIRERGMLWDFPERTEADLYLWLAEHRAALEEELGWKVQPETAAEDMVAQFSPRPGRVVARVGGKILDAVRPDELEAGPPPGQWRKQRLTTRQDDRLFADILVAINGEQSGWQALRQATELARREQAQLQGLHVVPSEAQGQSEAVQAIQADFQRHCQEAGLAGQLALQVGEVPRAISQRARWSDLVVAPLSHPPGPKALDRLGSGFRTLVRLCPRPILAVPRASDRLKCVLLAYDGSRKADEALFVATYLAGRWDVTVVVLTVSENERPPDETLQRAQDYLEVHGVRTKPIPASGDPADVILITAEVEDCDLVVMGGYGASPMLEVVLGSTVDQVLRANPRPTLICR